MANKTVQNISKSVGKAIGHGAGSLGKTIGGLGSQIFGGKFTADVGQGFGEGAFEGTKYADTMGKIGGGLGRAAGLSGTAYLLGKALKPMYNKMTGQESSKKIVTPEEKDWREKIAAKATGGLVGDFQTKDLDALSNNQDEGWRVGIKGIKKEAYSKIASEAIKSGDPTALWNEAARAAKAAGKNINTSNPLYLPQTFNRNGKLFAYAIDATETKKGKKPKFVPIEIGKGVNWGDDQQ